jgi:peptide-methionine (S)-S-oxide reductase
MMRITPFLLLAASLWSFTSTSLAEQPIAKAYFAGGCFWCTESDFEKIDGVAEAISGYMGGHTANPNYKSVSAGGTGHTEVVEVQYHPDQVSYAQLLEHFWHSIDPLTANAQFCDKGSQYRSAIFVTSPDERSAAEASKAKVAQQLGKPVATEINDYAPFTRAETYHQDYYKKNPLRYRYYRHGCGRDARLEAIWGPKKAD